MVVVGLGLVVRGAVVVVEVSDSVVKGVCSGGGQRFPSFLLLCLDRFGLVMLKLESVLFEA